MGNYMWKEEDILCFTANEAGSTIKLVQGGSATKDFILETSTNGIVWETYTVGATKTLTNIGDKIYWRNKSTADTPISSGQNAYYQFNMTGSIAASGDVTYLINKNSTKSVGYEGFHNLFYNCTSLTTAPKLPATNLSLYSYRNMFRGCTNLETLPALPATTIPDFAYNSMFYGCSKIKLSESQTGEYQTAYRIPTTGTGTIDGNPFGGMFTDTGGTFTGTPTVNTTYYTSNAIVS